MKSRLALAAAMAGIMGSSGYSYNAQPAFAATHRKVGSKRHKVRVSSSGSHHHARYLKREKQRRRKAKEERRDTKFVFKFRAHMIDRLGVYPISKTT